MNQLLRLGEWRLLDKLSESALARVGATVYVGALANWLILSPLSATSGFGRDFSYQVLAFATPFACLVIPVYRWFTRRPDRTKPAVLLALAGNAVLTPAVALAPSGWKLLALILQGHLTAFAAVFALRWLRAAAEPDHAGRSLGGAGAFGVGTIVVSRALGVETPDFPGIALQVMPLLLAASILWLPTPPPRSDRPAIKRPDQRWTTAAILMGCAVALTASAAYNNGDGAWSDLFCASGFLLSGVLLDTERLTIAIGAAATASVLASLSSHPSAGAISGLAQGLVQPLPWYIVMTQLRRDRWALILACGEAAVWAAWNMWDTTRQTDAALMSAMLSLLALTVMGTFGSKHNTAGVSSPPSVAEAPASDGSDLPADLPAAVQPLSVTEALEAVYGEILTPRELQVGRLVVLGVASREIAAQLYLSESTVKTHLKSLYRKTETANRNDLYRRLVATGIEDGPDHRVISRGSAALTAPPRDPLTDKLSRQALDRLLAERIMIDQTNQRPTALLYLALRPENQSGEKDSPTLAVVAGILQSSLRSMDVLCRCADQEFVALLPACDLTGAHLAGERLAHRVRAWASTRPSPLTLTVGWSSTSDGARTPSALLAEAAGRMASHPL